MGNHSEIAQSDTRNSFPEDKHPTDTKPTSPMSQALMTLEDEIDRLAAGIEMHSHRVYAVLGPELSDAPTEAKNPMELNSEIVRYIVDQAARVRNLRVALADLTHRVEL